MHIIFFSILLNFAMHQKRILFSLVRETHFDFFVVVVIGHQLLRFIFFVFMWCYRSNNVNDVVVFMWPVVFLPVLLLSSCIPISDRNERNYIPCECVVVPFIW